MTSEQVAAPTRRDQMKADRRRQLLDAAARLIAERGFVSVRLEDLGAAVGISGPGRVPAFPQQGCRPRGTSRRHQHAPARSGSAAAEAADSPSAALDALVEFHLDFALGEPDLIRIQDRDLESLPADARRQVRQTQRKYVEVWVGVLEQLDPQLDQADARIKAHATFGLINSTPHSANPLRRHARVESCGI